MKKLLTLILFTTITQVLTAQVFLSKTPIRVQDSIATIKFKFSDSTTAFIQKSNILYIVQYQNSNLIQVGFIADGGGNGTSPRMLSFSYTSITQPASGSAYALVKTLNTWLYTGVSTSTIDLSEDAAEALSPYNDSSKVVNKCLTGLDSIEYAPYILRSIAYSIITDQVDIIVDGVTNSSLPAGINQSVGSGILSSRIKIKSFAGGKVCYIATKQ